VVHRGDVAYVRRVSHTKVRRWWPEWLVLEQFPLCWRARRATDGEVVETQNRETIARAGEWILASDLGDRWVITTETLHKCSHIVAAER
jgi:hypothetical protein